MKCVKCGFEYKEGRNCPKCGEASIIVDADYYRRRQEWEESSRSKEEQEKEGIKIPTEQLKKALLIAAVVILAAGIVWFAAGRITEYCRIHMYQTAYEADEGYLYTCDGAFAYDMGEVFSGINAEFQEEYASLFGKAAAAVSYDEEHSQYCLYVSINGESRLLYTSADEIRILRVNSDGTILVRTFEYGDYNAVLSVRIFEIGETVWEIAEENMTMLETGKDGVYCFLREDGTACVYSAGKTLTTVYTGEDQKAIYALDQIYFIDNGILQEQDGTVIDTQVDFCSRVYGTNELLYGRDGTVIFVDASQKKYVLSGLDSNEELHNAIIVRAGNRLYINSRSGSVLSLSLKNGKSAATQEHTTVFLQ